MVNLAAENGLVGVGIGFENDCLPYQSLSVSNLILYHGWASITIAVDWVNLNPQ